MIEVTPQVPLTGRMSDDQPIMMQVCTMGPAYGTEEPGGSTGGSGRHDMEFCLGTDEQGNRFCAMVNRLPDSVFGD